MQASTVLVSVAPCRRHRTVLSRVLSAAPPPKHPPLHSRSPLALFRPRANTARTPKFAVASTTTCSRVTTTCSRMANNLLSRYSAAVRPRSLQRARAAAARRSVAHDRRGGSGFEVRGGRSSPRPAQPAVRGWHRVRPLADSEASGCAFAQRNASKDTGAASPFVCDTNGLAITAPAPPQPPAWPRPRLTSAAIGHYPRLTRGASRHAQPWPSPGEAAAKKPEGATHPTP